MNYLRFTSYIYLAAAAFLIYDGITKLNEDSDAYLLSFFLAAVTIFLFFFRRHFAKKFDGYRKNQDTEKQE
ncbi:MAG TPA: hypothetical protein VGB43_02745 [Flavobacterium sp.]|jgi:uncharacterized membrane protein YobD (UPF0266 family)